MRQRTLATAAATLRHTNLMRMAAFQGAQEEKARVEAARAEAAPTKREDVQVYAAGGDPGRVRIKWSCGRCGKRNDRPLAQPLQPKESAACRFCHAQAVFTIVPNQPEIEAEPAKESAA